MAEVTYADLKFMTLEQPRNQEPNEAKVKESPPPSPYWRLAAEILGIFCLGLLVTAGVLSVKLPLQRGQFSGFLQLLGCQEEDTGVSGTITGDEPESQISDLAANFESISIGECGALEVPVASAFIGRGSLPADSLSGLCTAR
ncbi:unnamed protein product [Caretta caretta]